MERFALQRAAGVGTTSQVKAHVRRSPRDSARWSHRTTTSSRRRARSRRPAQSLTPPLDAFEPTDTVAPGCLISGTPNERGVRQFTSDDGNAGAGIWACDTYREHIPDFPTDELFFVLEGTVTISEAGCEPQTYGAGPRRDANGGCDLNQRLWTCRRCVPTLSLRAWGAPPWCAQQTGKPATGG